MNKEEIAEKLFIAKFAAGVSADMNQIDSTRDSHPTGSVRKRLDPRQFLDGIQNMPREVIRQAVNPVIEPAPGDLVPMPTEADLVIQPEDEELKKLMARYEKPKRSASENPDPIHNYVPIGPSGLKPIPESTNIAGSGLDELRKAFNYIKRKIKVMEKNQQRLLELLEKKSYSASNELPVDGSESPRELKNER